MDSPYLKYYNRLLADRDDTQALLVNYARFHNGLVNEQASRKLKRIDEALDRIGNDTYGICVNCRAAISLERLDSLPYAELCLACQLMKESTT